MATTTMTTVRMRVLNAVKQGHDTRKAITDATGMQKGFAAVMGAVTKGKPGKGTLVGDGLLKADKGDDGWVYTLTAAGKQALQRCDKGEVAASMKVRHIERAAKPKAKASKPAKGSKAKPAKASKGKTSKPAKGSKAKPATTAA